MRTSLRYPGFEGYYQSDDVTQSTWTPHIQLREPAAANRLVKIIISTNGNAHTDTSLSVFGTALTQNVTHALNANGLSLYSAYVAAGQSGDVVAAVSANCTRWAMAIFASPRASATPAVIYTDAAGALDAALALTDGSIAVVGVSGVHVDTSRPCWVGMKPIFTHKIGTVPNFSVAMHRSRIVETRNVKSQWDNGIANPRLVGGVWA